LDPAIIEYRLNVNPTYNPIAHNIRNLGAERYATMPEEVQGLLDTGLIQESQFPK